MAGLQWRAAGLADNFGDGVYLAFAESRYVVIARLEGSLYAFSKHCPHVAGDMDRCEVSGTVVSCPFHAWRFDLAQSGREIHGFAPLRTYPLKVERGQVFVEF